MQLPAIKTFTAEDYNGFIKSFLFPLIALGLFLGFWSISASKVETSLGQLPGPVAVFEQASNLVDEHFAERKKEQDFYQRQEDRNAAKLAEDSTAEV